MSGPPNKINFKLRKKKKKIRNPRDSYHYTSTNERNSFDQKRNIKARDAGSAVNLDT